MAERTDNAPTVDDIHAQMESSPYYPHDLQSGWLPPPGSNAALKFVTSILESDQEPMAPSVAALNRLIEDNEVIAYLVQTACDENLNIIESHLKNAEAVGIPRIENKDQLLHGMNMIIQQAPQFVDNDLVGVPFSALVVSIDPTLSGVMLFSLPMFNDKMSAILTDWHTFLGTEDSNVGFRVDGKQWLSDSAKKSYDFPVWKKDSEELPYWKSWNSFFTRKFLDRDKERPIADPDSNATVICPNDGSLFRWQPDIAAKDVFWFKDMKYSLSDILSSPVPEQQAIIDEHELVDMFTGGYIFQTYLNPYNFHRWWSPVNGTPIFTPFAVPGYFFNKLVIPDFGGATTASLPYLAQVNARGISVFTTDYGHVCCIPLGMSEISTITFDPAIKQDVPVKKGQPLGMFNYGGSSFAIIYENIPGMELVFENAEGMPYPQQPPLPKGSSGAGKYVTSIGAQIGAWRPIEE